MERYDYYDRGCNIYIAGAIMHGGIAANDKHIREYDSIKVEYKDDDVGCIFDMIEKAYEDNPDQDFLGAAYMELGLGNHWTGQFFTPYNVSKMMAQMTLGTSIPEEKDFINNKDEKTHGLNHVDDSPMSGEAYAKRH